MPANPYELRADVRPLEQAAQRWSEIAQLMTRRGDEIVEAARRATDGWEAAAAESYDRHRRQVLANLDRFTTLADQISGSLRAVSSIITASQKELDQSWSKVATIPHDVVGESRYLVFRPEADDDRGKVTRGQGETDEIRGRLTLSLDQESTRLRSARAELVMVRTELMHLASGGFPGQLGPATEVSGVGSVPPASTSVLGSPQGGVAAGLPPITPVSVAIPELTGISGGLAPIVAAAAGGVAGSHGAGRRQANGVPPISGMGVGAMGARAGTMAGGAAGGRGGSGGRLATPRPEKPPDDTAARGARDRDAAKKAAKEAKRAVLAERRADRAARKAERESEREAEREAERDAGRDAADRPAAIAVVHHAPGEEPPEDRR